MQHNNDKSNNVSKNTNLTTSKEELIAISSLVTVDSSVITVDSDINVNLILKAT